MRQRRGLGGTRGFLLAPVDGFGVLAARSLVVGEGGVGVVLLMLARVIFWLYFLALLVSCFRSHSVGVLGAGLMVGGRGSGSMLGCCCLR